MLVLAPIIKLLSYLPLRWLYALSNAVFFLLYHVFTYRRVTVRRNLSMSFPDMPGREMRAVERKFYRHLADLLAEGVRSFSMPARELEHRVRVVNPELITACLQKGKGVLGVTGHLGNWEWVLLRLAQVAGHPVHALYQPSGGAAFDRWLRKNRQRFGARLVSTRHMKPLLEAARQGPVAVGSLADQSPVDTGKAHWMYFLRQPTPVYTGPEKLARRYDLAVVYLDVRKTARGYYEIRFELVTDRPGDLPEGALTELHTRLLEQSIARQPEIWLWSHRRWKRSHLRPPHFG